MDRCIPYRVVYCTPLLRTKILDGIFAGRRRGETLLCCPFSAETLVTIPMQLRPALLLLLDSPTAYGTLTGITCSSLSVISGTRCYSWLINECRTHFANDALFKSRSIICRGATDVCTSSALLPPSRSPLREINSVRWGQIFIWLILWTGKAFLKTKPFVRMESSGLCRNADSEEEPTPNMSFEKVAIDGSRTGTWPDRSLYGKSDGILAAAIFVPFLISSISSSTGPFANRLHWSTAPCSLWKSQDWWKSLANEIWIEKTCTFNTTCQLFPSEVIAAMACCVLRNSK